LDAIEEHAADKLRGVDPAELEWYHRLRNLLYHQGNGLTVEMNKVQVYAELAKVLFKNLFGFELLVAEQRLPRFRESDMPRITADLRQDITGFTQEESITLERFLMKWNDLTECIVRLAAEVDPTEQNVRWHGTPAIETAKQLAEKKLISTRALRALQQLAGSRNRIVHGKADVKTIRPRTIAEMDDLMNELQKTIEQ
jgi:hypothetical protein